jgi:dipeptidyl aminopeptidase/acylaminoacyl peptidase
MRTIEDLVDISAAGLPAWSPVADRIAFLHDRPGFGWELRLIDAGGASRALSERPVSPWRPAWAPDGSLIAVVRGNERGGSDIWLVPTVDGEERLLVAGRSETRAPSFSPDGAWLAYISGDDGTLDVWVVELTSGEARRLTSDTNPLDEPRWTPRWSPDGQWIAYVSSRSGERNNDDLWLVSPDGTRHRQLTSGIWVNTDACWSPDGRQIAVIANAETEHWYGDDADLWLVAADDGPLARLSGAGGYTWRLEGAGPVWSPDGGTLYTLHHHRGDRNIAATPASGGPSTLVTALDGAVLDFTLSPDGARLALIHASQTQPPELLVVPAAGGMPRRLKTNQDCALEAREPRRLAYCSFDGIYCDAYLYLPPDFDESRTYPGLIQVHGGGTNSYGNGWHPAEQWLAGQGFVVMAVEYRGSSGYGRDFAGLSYGDWGGGQTRDAVAAGEWLKAQPWIGKIGIYGGSYGGYLTLHSIVAAPDLFDAAVDMYGKTNMITGQQHADRVGRVFVARDYWNRMGPEIPEAMERASTHHRLHEIKTPLLILHGDRDTRVPPGESAQVAETLSAAGIPHEYVEYPGEGHGFRKREHRIDCYRRMLAWFNDRLQ